MRVDRNGNFDLSDRELEYLSPWWFVASLLLGALVIAISILGTERYGWHAVYVSVSVNIGTAIGLVGVRERYGDCALRFSSNRCAHFRSGQHRSSRAPSSLAM